MNPIPKFMPIFAFSYLLLTAVGSGTSHLFARLELIETVPQNISALFLVATWCVAIEVAARDGRQRRRFARGQLDTRQTVEHVAYHQGLIANRRRVALAATVFGLVFHLVIEGIILNLVYGKATIEDLPILVLIIQAGVFYVLSYVCLPSPPRGGGGGRKRRSLGQWRSDAPVSQTN